jgi:hypothetical protein
MHAAQDGGGQGLGGAGGDGDLGGRIVGMAVQLADLGRDRLPQRRHARHRRILVVAGAHGLVHRIEQRRIAAEVGETLAEVDGAMLGRQR